MSILHTLKHELRELFPPALFFFLALHFVALEHHLLARGPGITAGTSASVALAALILGKAVLLANHLPFIHRFPDRPMVYNILWKAVIYLALSILLHLGERYFELRRAGESFGSQVRHVLATIGWPGFVAVQLMLLLLILLYCTIQELTLRLGPAEMRALFFGVRTRAPA